MSSELTRIQIQGAGINSFQAKTQTSLNMPAGNGGSLLFQSYEVFEPNAGAANDGLGGQLLLKRKFFNIQVDAVGDSVVSDSQLLLANAADTILENRTALFAGYSIPPFEVLKIDLASEGSLAKVMLGQLRQLNVPDANLTVNLPVVDTELSLIYSPVGDQSSQDQQLTLINQAFEDSPPMTVNASSFLPAASIINQAVNHTYYLEVRDPIPGSLPDEGARLTTARLVQLAVAGPAFVSLEDVRFVDEQLAWRTSVMAIRQDGSNIPELLEVYVDALSGSIIREQRATVHAHSGSGVTDFYYPEPTTGTALYSYSIRELDNTGVMRGAYADVHSLGGREQVANLNYTGAIDPSNGQIVDPDFYFEGFSYVQAAQSKDLVNVLGFNSLLNSPIRVEEDNSFITGYFSNSNPSLRRVSITTLDARDIILPHERGHEFQNDISPNMILLSSQPLRSIAEGTADVFVGMLHDDPYLFKYVASLVGFLFVRTIKNNLIDQGGDIHIDGLIIAGLFWDLRNRYGNATAARIMLRSLEYTGLSDDFRSFVQINMVQAANSLMLPEVAEMIAILGKQGRNLEPFSPLNITSQPWDALETAHPHADNLVHLESYNVPGASELYVTVGANSKSVITGLNPPAGDTFQMYDQFGTNYFSGTLFLEEVRGRCFQLPGEAVIIQGSGPTDGRQANGIYIEDVSTQMAGNTGPQVVLSAIPIASNYEFVRVRFNLIANHPHPNGKITSAKLTVASSDEPYFFDLNHPEIELIIARASMPRQNQDLEYALTVTDNNCIERVTNGIVELGRTLGGPEYVGDATVPLPVHPTVVP